MHPWSTGGLFSVMFRVSGLWIVTPSLPGWKIVVYPSSNILCMLMSNCCKCGIMTASLAFGVNRLKGMMFCLLFASSLHWVDGLSFMIVLRLVSSIPYLQSVMLLLNWLLTISLIVLIFVMFICLFWLLVVVVWLWLHLFLLVPLLFCRFCLGVGPNSSWWSGEWDSCLFYWVALFPVATSLFLIGAPCTFRCFSLISRILGVMRRFLQVPSTPLLVWMDAFCCSVYRLMRREIWNLLHLSSRFFFLSLLSELGVFACML